jgi:Secretion system C-terminal sorting domain
MKTTFTITFFLITIPFIFAQNVQSVTILNNAAGFCPNDAVTINYTVSGTPASSYRFKLYEVRSSTNMEPNCPTPTPRPDYNLVLSTTLITTNSHTFNLPSTLNPIGFETFDTENNIFATDPQCQTVNIKITTVAYRVEVSTTFGNNPRIANININNCTANPLPVNYLYFNAEEKPKNVTLNWATSTENNNDYFVIEHSTEGKIFVPIGRVEAKQNSFENQEYQFINETPKQGIAYYRLNQFDKNGNNNYSKIISVQWDDRDKNKLTFFPNPVDHRLEIVIENRVEMPQVSFVSNDGRLLKYIVLKGNMQKNSIDLSDLKSGYYMAIFDIDGQKTIRKIIKK